MLETEIKQCEKCQSKFEIEEDDFKFYEKMKVPAPTFCPECRAKRRMSFYNVRSLYSGTCDKCQKNIISIYSKGAKFPVYCQECWWADDWDAVDYSAEYDFSKKFFEQFNELFSRVPRVSLEADFLKSVNSPYTNAAADVKNCYLIFAASFCEDSMYCMKVDHLKDVLDSTNTSNSEGSYQLFNCGKMYNSTFSVDCNDGMNIHFSKNLKNCQDCFGCVNLRNKSYHLFNKQYSKEEYKQKIDELRICSHEGQKIVLKEIKKLFLKFPIKYIHGYKNIDVTGDYIFNSKNVKEGNGVIGGENIRFSQMIEMSPVKDSYDYTNWGQNASQIYEAVASGENVNNLKFVQKAVESYEIEYSNSIFGCNNLFGCVGLRKKKYCILNRQYEKEEYLKMIEKIKAKMKDDGEYGEFFPAEDSQFCYNETIAQEFFPLTKDEAEKHGYRWKNREMRDYKTTIKAKNLPDDIRDVEDSIIREVISCATPDKEKERTGCADAFKIIPAEWAFYKKHSIPLPRKCPNCRHYDRLKNRNPIKLYARECMKEGCNIKFKTTYSPEREDIVYCEKCYNEKVN